MTSFRIVEICYQFRENSCLHLYTNIGFISQVCYLFSNVNKEISRNSTSTKLETRLYFHLKLETINHCTFSRLTFVCTKVTRYFIFPRNWAILTLTWTQLRFGFDHLMDTKFRLNWVTAFWLEAIRDILNGCLWGCIFFPEGYFWLLLLRSMHCSVGCVPEPKGKNTTIAYRTTTETRGTLSAMSILKDGLW